MTDNSNLSLMPLMRAQIAREMLDYPTGWITDRNPPEGFKSYLTYCENRDGVRYQAVHYWHNQWHSPGPFVTVLQWMELPKV